MVGNDEVDNAGVNRKKRSVRRRGHVTAIKRRDFFFRRRPHPRAYAFLSGQVIMPKLSKMKQRMLKVRESRGSKSKSNETGPIRPKARVPSIESSDDPDKSLSGSSSENSSISVQKQPKIRKIAKPCHKRSRNVGATGKTQGRSTRSKRLSMQVPPSDTVELAKGHFSDILVKPAEFLEQQTLSAEQIIDGIFDCADFKCTCDHYLIGASSFLDMLKLKSNFDKQHKKYGYYDHTFLAQSIEFSYAYTLTAVDSPVMRSVKYPFLCASPDIVHVVNDRTYYDEIKATTSERFSSFWNQRYLFQLFIASLLHKADHYRIIGIRHSGMVDGCLPESIDVAACIEVVFKFDVLETDFMRDKMVLGYYAFLKRYFFCTGVPYTNAAFDCLKKAFARAHTRPHSSIPVGSSCMKMPCLIYLKCYDPVPKFEQINKNEDCVDLKLKKAAYNEIKSQQRFAKSLSLNKSVNENNMDALENHPFRRVAITHNYHREAELIEIGELSVTRIKVVIDEGNWSQFFDDFVTWDRVLAMFKPWKVKLSAINELV